MTNNNDIPPVQDESLQELSDDLQTFVNVYRKYLLIPENDKRSEQILHNLEVISNMLRQKRYSELFDNNVKIEYSEERIEHLPF